MKETFKRSIKVNYMSTTRVTAVGMDVNDIHTEPILKSNKRTTKERKSNNLESSNKFLSQIL